MVYYWKKRKGVSMIQAYVLINLSSTEAKRVVKDIRNAGGVKQAHLVTGLHDVVAFVEAEDLYGIRDIITDNILTIPGVSKTITMLVVDGV